MREKRSEREMKLDILLASHRTFGITIDGNASFEEKVKCFNGAWAHKERLGKWEEDRRGRTFLLNSTLSKAIVLSFPISGVFYWKHRRRNWVSYWTVQRVSVTLVVCLSFLIGWGCSGVSNKVELTAEFLLSDWLKATQFQALYWFKYVKPFLQKRVRQREGEKGGRCSLVFEKYLTRFHWLLCCKTLTVQ